MTKVLIVLTGAKEWSLKNGSKHFGGVWSPEFVYPHDCFTKAGYQVVVATLGGVSAAIDPASLSLGLQENDQTAVDFQRDYLQRPEIEAALARPARLEALDTEEFDVIFCPWWVRCVSRSRGQSGHREDNRQAPPRREGCRDAVQRRVCAARRTDR